MAASAAMAAPGSWPTHARTYTARVTEAGSRPAASAPSRIRSRANATRSGGHQFSSTPSATSPASRMALGFNAASQIGTASRPGWNERRNRSFSGVSTSSPARADRSRVTYSRRRSRTPGPTGPVPRPRTNRPPEISYRVAAAIAVVDRRRATIVTMPVPRRSASVYPDSPAKVEKASRPELSGTNRASYPACSAVWTISTRSGHGTGSRMARPRRGPRVSSLPPLATAKAAHPDQRQEQEGHPEQPGSDHQPEERKGDRCNDPQEWVPPPWPDPPLGLHPPFQGMHVVAGGHRQEHRQGAGQEGEGDQDEQERVATHGSRVTP